MLPVPNTPFFPTFCHYSECCCRIWNFFIRVHTLKCSINFSKIFSSEIMFKNEHTFFLRKKSYSRLQNFRATGGQKPDAVNLSCNTQQILENSITERDRGGGAVCIFLNVLFLYSYMSVLCVASYSGHSVFVGYSSRTLRDHQFVIVCLKTTFNSSCSYTCMFVYVRIKFDIQSSNISTKVWS